MTMKVLVPVLAAFVLTACGGGGGSGGGGNKGGDDSVDFSLAKTTVNFVGVSGGTQPSAISINGTLSNTSSTVYLLVDASSTPLIQNASVDVVSTSSGVLTLVPQLPSALTIGKHTGNVTVRACKNQSCTSEYSGSPKIITVNYEVTAPASLSSSSSISSTSSSLISSSSSLSTSSSSSSSLSSSSSSSSSSVPALACNSAGVVFVDGVCSPWQQLSAYEQKYADSTINYENTSGNSGNAVSFNIIQSADAGRNKVLDIKYLDTPAYYGAVHIRAPGSPINKIDMSEYAHGKIVFDLKVISHSAQNSALEFSIECTWPCASTTKMIKTDVLNEWKTYEFSVAEMIDRGLDIKRASTGFSLLPTWAKQDGAHFQVDNVRWVKGEAPAAEETVCYANRFDDEWVQNMQGVGVSIVGEDILVPEHQRLYLTTGVKPWVTANPSWSVMNGTWFYWMSSVMNYSTMELLDPNRLSDCSGSGTLSLEIYTPAALVEDGKMTFTLQFLDSDNVVHDLASDVFLVADMKPDDWSKVSVPLSTAYSKLKYVGIQINATQVSPTLISPPFYIDNIVIKK